MQHLENLDLIGLFDDLQGELCDLCNAVLSQGQRLRNGFKNDTCALAILNIGGVQDMAFGASDHPGAGFGVLIRDGEPSCMRAGWQPFIRKMALCYVFQISTAIEPVAVGYPPWRWALGTGRPLSRKTTPGTAAGVMTGKGLKLYVCT